jgi:succinate dehydrogenase/fumarate reductase iron-sulfur protein
MSIRRPIGFHTLKVPEMTVLEALHQIKAEKEPTLAWRSSCRMGVCGSCGMFINNLPMLACQTQILHLNADVVTVAPLPNYPNVKDLVPNLDVDRNTRPSSRFIHTNSKWMNRRRFIQSAEEREFNSSPNA